MMRTDGAISGDAFLPKTVVIGGLLNGLAFQVLAAWRSAGVDWRLDVSPLLLLVGLSAAVTLARLPPTAVQDQRWVTVAAMLLLLVPSSVVAWGVTGAYAAWLAARSGAPARVPLLLAVALTACALWQIFAPRLLGLWMLLPDAVVVERALDGMGYAVSRAGNVISGDGGHQIVILDGCSTLLALPGMLAAAAATAEAGSSPRQLAARLAAAAVIFAALNVARLLLMGCSPGWYHAVHGTVGQNIFDGLLICLLLARPPVRRGPARRLA